MTDLRSRANCACCIAEVRQITARVNRDLSRRGFIAGVSTSVALLGLAAYSGPARAQDSSGRMTVVKNVNLFNGVDGELKGGANVVVQGDKVVDIVTGDFTPSENATVIDVAGRTLMPGLIDARWHTMIAALSVPALLSLAVGDTSTSPPPSRQSAR